MGLLAGFCPRSGLLADDNVKTGAGCDANAKTGQGVGEILKHQPTYGGGKGDLKVLHGGQNRCRGIAQ